MTNEPAFPQTIDDMGTMRSVTEGLTKREYAAIHILAAFITDNPEIPTDQSQPNILCECSLKLADELLRQANEKDNK